MTSEQFEELVVYDSSYNSKIVDIFLQRYEDIKNIQTILYLIL